ncbi:MAG TPA: HAMP domain-containing sensor histidine kinase [Conexibacter sp.]|jgi:two-component system OmpR family sensor kinase|nr:HAMP domain-containing sensor histidine kinase [Conexibacter sp.]
MRSLRARLVAGLLALAAVGLLVLGGITYAEQRSFLLHRVDQQLHAATLPISAALDGRLPVPGGLGNGRPFGGRERGGPGFGLPEGTYAERRDATGAVAASTFVRRYGDTTSARPDLPADLPVAKAQTVDDGAYRVLATPDPGSGGLNVVAIPLADVSQTLDRLLLVEALVIAAVLLVLGLAARLVVRVGLLPLERMGHTAGAIAGGDLSHRVEPEDPRTEVGRLGLALNAMLERLERAFAGQKASEDRLRQFLADASHELRTPLQSIRGYAELFRIGAAREPGDVEKAMRRIEQESARMGVLVEDLLTLARLGETRDGERAPVDLAALARDAVSDARATAPERAIELHAEGAAGAATVLGDPHQLAQVLANLLRNALVHTPAGTPIEVTVARAGEQARLAVRDHGPGLPPGDPAELFERFWRAERGRERGKAGAGLGLAIVAGVVERHGGRVEAANAPGGGAAFAVHLPLAARSF